MSNGLRARIVDIHGIEIAGITGCAQTLVLRLKLNNAQNIVNNVGSGGHDAHVLAGPVTDAPRNSLPARQTEQWSYRALVRHEKVLSFKVVRQPGKAFQEKMQAGASSIHKPITSCSPAVMRRIGQHFFSIGWHLHAKLNGLAVQLIECV
jgi:hypothetical protein